MDTMDTSFDVNISIFEIGPLSIALDNYKRFLEYKIADDEVLQAPRIELALINSVIEKLETAATEACKKLGV